MAPFAHLPEHVVHAWPKLSQAAKDAAVAVASFSNGTKGWAFAMIPTMAERVGKSPRHVRRGLSELRSLGLIESQRGGPHNSWRHRWAGRTGQSPLTAPDRTGQSATPDKPVPSDPPDRTVPSPLTRQTGQTSPPDRTGQSPRSIRISNTTTAPEIEELRLYRNDEKLRKRWPELLEAWRQAYPGVDIVAETRKAHAWEVANPSKRKRDRARFLTNWLGRAAKEPQPESGGPKYDPLERL